MTDEYAKEYFNGKCPYTGKECETFDCSKCEVEKEEQEFMEREE